ncbi:aldose epimerase family protein [Flavobacterium silvaticum]|uniref:Aldose 1-epimerase n=1 Tax=Flavobacterium silvaticum TaxID=1852020 RepID=A0A972FU91_9FLAO|nr:aldose epimerase family protein [Flavobacterium silvaticum]NMH28613.1 galactose mutarotase [Flavobacterium silvaticum]
MNTIKKSILFLFAAASFTACKKEVKIEKTSTTVIKDNMATDAVTKSDYATMADGTKIEKYTLKNKNGMTMEVITFGGIITSLTAPDKDGKYQDIVLGYTKADDYFNGNPYFFGAIIGRYGNRIAKGKFSLDGKPYQLTVNDGPNSLHGGKGFDKRVWTADAATDGMPSIRLSYTSKDGEEGYPGNLTTAVIYTLTDDNALEITYDAETDKKTIVNLTQHSYFNLSGDFKTILDHELELKADKMLPVDATLIPTGELKAVAGTPFDFTTLKQIGKDINAADDQLKKGQGYDHCWVFTDASKELREVGALYHKASGRYMQVFTDQPSIQFYSGNFLDGTKASKNGGKYEKRSGLCLETQHYPDSPNEPKFPTTTLNPGEKYHTKTVYKFSVK